MANRFRNPRMRRAYDDCVLAFRNRSKLLFTNGVPTRGNGIATAFWRGYEGVPQNWDTYSRQSFAYAAYCAGADEAKG